MKSSTRLLSSLLAVALAMPFSGAAAFADEQPESNQQTTEQAPTPDVGAPEADAPAMGTPEEGSGSPSDTGDAAGVAASAQTLSAVSETRAGEQPNNIGSVVVEAGRALDAAREVNLAIVLESSDAELGYSESRSIELPAAANQSEAASSLKTVRFDGLAAGTYLLKVHASGFAGYEQSIAVANDANSVKIYAGAIEYALEKAHPGMLVYGDTTQDQVIDQEDANAIIALLDEGAARGIDNVPADGSTCDLDGDDFITLSDLLYVTESLGKEPVVSTVERTVSPAAVSAEVEEDVSVEDDRKIAEVVGNTGDPVKIVAPDIISEEKPLSVDFELAKEQAKAPVLGGMTIASPQGSESAKVTSGYVFVFDESGTEFKVPIGKAAEVQSRGRAARITNASASIAADGTIVVDFGGQIAVKKVTLVITDTSKGANLAEISKVEFLNDIESKIPEPDMNVPENLAAVVGNKQFSLTWNKAANVTGYEVSISQGGKEEIKRTTGTSLVVNSFNNDKLINKTNYAVKIQSINGTWRSGWSEPITATPLTDKVPGAPDGLVLKGAYRAINASWKLMKDTDSYNLFYREKGTETFTKVENIEKASFTIGDLKDDVEYQVYVVGVNDIGSSQPSLTAVARTINVKPAQLPAYHLLNVQDADDRYLSHIVSATYGRGKMENSPLDSAQGAAQKSALGVFDNDYTSYLKVNDWDEGGAYPGDDKGVTVQFDEPQTLGMISFAEVEDGAYFGYSDVRYLDESNVWRTVGSSIQTKTCENGRRYALVKLASPVTTSKVKLGVGRGSAYQRNVIIAEMRFHTYDTLESDIMGLYADDLHLVLKETVDAAAIDALQKRLDTPEAESGEFHPYRSALQVELDNARTLLESKGLDNPVRVHAGISAEYDKRNLGFGGFNAWQPLGAVAGSGDEIVIYVGAAGVATGTKAPLQLVMSQQHPESSAVAQVVSTNLKAGRNEITLPTLSSTDAERGGQLYVAYTGSNKSASWGVRVSGASSVPTLDLYQVEDAAERTARTEAYVSALDQQVAKLQSDHDALHKGNKNGNLNYDYAERTCILNATDIVLDQMMYSVPAKQVLASAGSGSVEQRAAKLLAAYDGMDQMMELFYQHKGLAPATAFEKGTPADVVSANTMPSQHLNIRYTKMFDGAFMYAAGNHIGIEWGSVPGLGNASPVQLDENGAKVSGSYFGWGISHEIGHNINQSQYAVVEVTNNYFAQLTASDETDATTRFSYADVFERVTSGDEGRVGDVGLQMAMYWQLRLVYDDAPAYKLYGTYQEMTQNRLFARIDSYARMPEKAPAPGGVALKLGAGEAQNIMRLASAAAERDLTAFFTCWGLTPDADTATYLAQFEKEPRAICYATDDARAYARTHEDTGAVAGKSVVEAEVAAKDAQVTLTIDAPLQGAAADSVLGYEIARITYSGGKPEREVVGFAPVGSDGEEAGALSGNAVVYVDNASSMNNRTVTYEVTAVDKFLNRSQAHTVNPVKIAGDGMHDKSGWTATTNMESEQDQVPPATEEDPDAPEPKLAVNNVLDGKSDTIFTGVAANADPNITIDMGKSTEVSAVRVAFADAASAAGTFRIETSSDGQNYTKVREAAFDLDGSNTAMLYFENGKDPWVSTFDARYLRITALGQAGKQLSFNEVDVFGPSGDNVEFLSADGETAMGVLKSDFVYEQGIDGKDAQFIPAGSIVFTGAYKGNPAYNVVVLYDSEGNVVGGTTVDGSLTANQIIMAPAPGNALLGETSEGRWVYWINPRSDGTLPTLPPSVRAELYRVNNALTNEGQRIVSDTLFTSVPAQLPEIELKSTPKSNQETR